MKNTTVIDAVTTAALPSPPRHSLSDYFVLILLSLCIAIGVPMTVMTCWQLMQRLRSTGGSSFWCRCVGHRRRRNRTERNRRQATRTPSGSSTLSPARRTYLLKLQLNIADLMVLIFYAFSKVVWTLTYNWRGGEFLCKLVRFLSVLSFHMCSNSVACIGLDRIITLLRFSSTAGRSVCRKACPREYFMLGISCALALLCSLPQFWIWTVVDVVPNWPQCVAVWVVSQRTRAEMSPNETSWAEIYNIFHLLTIFWIPCAIIAISYIAIVVQVLLHLKEPPSEDGRDRRRVSNHSSPSRKNTTASLPVQQTDHALQNRRFNFGQRILKCGRLTRFLCRQTLTILTVYIICWCPYNVLTLWIHFKPQHAHVFSTTIRFLQELIVVNSVINPFLYACDVYHQMLDDRRRQDPNSCLCCFFTCPCALMDDSDEDTVEVL